MKKMMIFFALSGLLIQNSFATTWDEPWTDSIIKSADYFVFAKIVSCDDEVLKLKIIKQLGGEALPEEIKVKCFSLLDLTSTSSGHGVEFDFGKMEEGYFFLKKSEKGEYCLPTPTSGFDYIQGDEVIAVYRHSYHKAKVPVDIYELTMTAIFNYYHNLPYDKEKVRAFVDEQLELAPAGFEDNEIQTFFLQHVSLECIYHLKLDGYYNKILPFFNDTSNWHNQISGARALVTCNTSECKTLLLTAISGNSFDIFTKVICIWTLAELNPKELKSDLEKLIPEASTESNGFGGNIMDPRVGTSFPDVRTALQNLVDKL